MKLQKSVSAQINSRIQEVRGVKVILDLDLAELYGVGTKKLNQAVSRNLARFPSDFMFKLTGEEKSEVVTNCDHLRRLKFSPVLPRAFTEQGVAMLSGVLKSPKAIEANVAIMRAFVQMRAYMLTQREFARRLNALEGKVDGQGKDIAKVFGAIRQMMAWEDRPKPKIGFKSEPEKGPAAKKEPWKRK